MNIAALFSSEVPPQTKPSAATRQEVAFPAEPNGWPLRRLGEDTPAAVGAFSINDAPLVPGTCTRVVLLRIGVLIVGEAGNRVWLDPQAVTVIGLDEWTIGGAQLQV